MNHADGTSDSSSQRRTHDPDCEAAAGEEGRKEQLSAFLKARRAEAIPIGSELRPRRRRAAGLRREEVAQRAGISVAWYQKLEQGQDVTPSRKTLACIGDALGLNKTQRSRLEALVYGDGNPPSSMPNVSLEKILHRLDPYPAYVQGRYWDVIRANSAMSLVFGNLEEAPWGPKNFIWSMFTSNELRHRLVDWEVHARLVLGRFRADWARYHRDRRYAEIAHALQQVSAEVRSWWDEDTALSPLGPHHEICHPDAGAICLSQLVLNQTVPHEFRVVGYAPVTEGDEERLHLLQARSASELAAAMLANKTDETSDSGHPSIHYLRRTAYPRHALLRIRVRNRIGLLNDLTAVIRRANVDIAHLETHLHEDITATIYCVVVVTNPDQAVAIRRGLAAIHDIHYVDHEGLSNQSDRSLAGRKYRQGRKTG